jgi:hypothetical protein
MFGWLLLAIHNNESSLKKKAYNLERERVNKNRALEIIFTFSDIAAQDDSDCSEKITVRKAHNEVLNERKKED